MTEAEATRHAIAAHLSVSVDELPEDVGERLQSEPQLVHHLGVTQGDPDLRRLVVRALQSTTSTSARLPSGRLVGNGVVSALRWVASGLRLVPDDVRTERLESCLTCPYARREKMTAVYRFVACDEEEVVCGKCGCPVHSKCKVQSEACPDGRWSR